MWILQYEAARRAWPWRERRDVHMPMGSTVSSARASRWRRKQLGHIHAGICALSPPVLMPVQQEACGGRQAGGIGPLRRRPHLPLTPPHCQSFVKRAALKDLLRS